MEYLLQMRTLKRSKDGIPYNVIGKNVLWSYDPFWERQDIICSYMVRTQNIYGYMTRKYKETGALQYYLTV